MEKFLEIITEMEKPTDRRSELPADRKGGFYDGNGILVTAGDHVIHQIDGRRATLINALQDGDADVRWDDDKPGMVKWSNLRKI